jgi:hypothetical protein
MMAERAIARDTCDALSEKSIRHRPESARDISHQPGLQKSETRGGAGRSRPAEGQVSGGVAMLSVQAYRQPSCFHAKAAQAPFVLDSAPGGMLYGAGLLWPHPTFQLCPHPRALGEALSRFCNSRTVLKHRQELSQINYKRGISSALLVTDWSRDQTGHRLVSDQTGHQTGHVTKLVTDWSRDQTGHRLVT